MSKLVPSCLIAAVCICAGIALADLGDTEAHQGLPIVSREDSQTTLNGYRLGRYPPREAYPEVYNAPQRFYEVTPKNRTQRISTHFRLEQFLCKQPAGWPRYLALRPELIERLEQIVTVLSQEEIHADSLVIMSGYRTPLYNASLGNVPRSRHIYGDAADLYVDADGDNRMDDLNGDGKLDVEDAVWLARLIESVDSKAAELGLEGGLAAYPPTEAHGGFVHVDTRGFPVRWGKAL